MLSITSAEQASNVVVAPKCALFEEARESAESVLDTHGCVREDGLSSLQRAEVGRSVLRSSKKTFTAARPEAAATSLDESSKALIIHGPAHRGTNGAAMPTEDDQDGYFFFNHPERAGLLCCLGARSPCYCCLDPISPH